MLSKNEIKGDKRLALVLGKMEKGCELCFPGLKAVIFITGICGDNCYYCPVSKERFGKDIIYVNEEKVNSLEEVVLEIERQGAMGASITGGDPLAVYPRTLKVIKILKDRFGKEFHIHLYTSGRYATPDVLLSLWKAGLDEIRFHPVKEEYKKAIEYASRLTSMRVGAEIPIAKGLENWAINVIKDVEKYGGSFVNLDEMEFVEPNAAALISRGLNEDEKRPFTAKGSYEAAIKVLEWAKQNSNIYIHFCPASFKDSVQTKNRFIRLAKNDKRWYEEITSYGTIIWGEVNINNETIKFNPKNVNLYKGYSIKIFESHPTRSRRPIINEETINT
ncbi:MAG: radical SAM protein [Caldisphaera sp.]